MTTNPEPNDEEETIESPEKATNVVPIRTELTPGQLRQLAIREAANARIKERFSMVTKVTKLVTGGEARSAIFSGPTGIGKSHTVNKELARYDNGRGIIRSASGTATKIGLLGLLHKYRHRGCILKLDDIDDIFDNQGSMNYLKLVCDNTSLPRLVTVASSRTERDEDKQPIPSPFLFEASVIIITNLPILTQAQISGGQVKASKRAIQLAALVGRSVCLDLEIVDVKDILARIMMVVDEEGLLDEYQLVTEEMDEIRKWFRENHKAINPLSLRSIQQLAMFRKNFPDASGENSWVHMANNTLLQQNMRPLIVP